MNVLMLTGPFFMLQVYDRVLTSRSLATLLALALIAGLLYAFFGIFDYVRQKLLVRVARAFDNSLSQTVHDLSAHTTLQRHSPAHDLHTVQQFTASPAIATLYDVPWFPVYLFVVFLLHPWLGLFALAGAALVVTVAVLNQLLSRHGAAEVADKAQMEDRLLSATRSQVETLDAMGMLGNVRNAWSAVHDERLAAHQAMIDRQALMASTSKTLRLVLQSAILGLGAYLVIANELSAGVMIAASIIFGRALAPLDQTIAHWRSIASARAAYTRLRTTCAEPVAGDRGTALQLPHQTFSVSDLFVATPDRKSVLLQGVSFELKAGDALGIIGASGGGKSTLLKGLLGLRPCVRGEVRFDGATIDQWADDKRGAIVGYLPQDIELYPGTIAQNIARFKPDAPSKATLDAAEFARVHELVVSKPEGFDTVVGPGGHALSAGERQRVALARAVYGKPFLVVLDEPNSNMDVTGEQALSETIKLLREKGSIVIVVTHRSAVLAQVNKLLHIEHGRMMAFGDTPKVLARIREQQKARAARGLHVVDA
jgi:ATP-binding cassette subfamily C protein